MRDAKTMSALAALFMGLSAWGADPVPASEQKQPARIVASPASAEPAKPLPGVPTPCDVDKFVWIGVTVEKDGKQVPYEGAVTWDDSPKGIVQIHPKPPKGAVVPNYYPGKLQSESASTYHKIPFSGAIPCLGVKEGTAVVSAWGIVDGEAKRIAELTIQVGPRPPPPDPKPIDPDKPKPPVPVTSFRVILGYESAATMTQAQVNVLYGSVVETWLNENCTGGKSGWRRRDKDANGDADPTMAALWKAVQEKITSVPFAAVERNGVVEIIPLEPTPAAMIAKLTKYREGK